MTVGLIQRCGLCGSTPSSRESFSVGVKWWLAGVALVGATLTGLVLTHPSAASASKSVPAQAPVAEQHSDAARANASGIVLPQTDR